jgi:putative hemolysin
MLLPAVFLFLFCLLASAFFAAAETAFIASSPYSLEYHAKKGSKRAGAVRKILSRINDFLVTILIGNTLASVTAAAIATSVFVTLIPERNRAVLYATITTTLCILVIGEINPKTFAAHNPLRIALLFSYPIQGLMVLFFPFIKFFSFLSGLLMPSSRTKTGGRPSLLNEEEIRVALLAGARGLSDLRRKMISGALDIGARPVKEIMIPRPQVRAINAEASLETIVETIQSAGYSRYPVFRGRLDNIEGVIRAKDIVIYIIDNKSFTMTSVLRKPFFVPELASLENVLVQMQENAVHMAFVVDEFGNMEGLVTLEDIIEEIIGDIRDEQDGELEECITRLDGGALLIKGSTPIKAANEELGLGIPEKSDYTTLAGFFLYEFGRIPVESDALDFGRFRLTVEKMNKRHIGLLRLDVEAEKGPPSS